MDKVIKKRNYTRKKKKVLQVNIVEQLRRKRAEEQRKIEESLSGDELQAFLLKEYQLPGAKRYFEDQKQKKAEQEALEQKKKAEKEAWDKRHNLTDEELHEVLVKEYTLKTYLLHLDLYRMKYKEMTPEEQAKIFKNSEESRRKKEALEEAQRKRDEALEEAQRKRDEALEEAQRQKDEARRMKEEEEQRIKDAEKETKFEIPENEKWTAERCRLCQLVKRCNKMNAEVRKMLDASKFKKTGN